MAKHLVISASPRALGKSARAAKDLAALLGKTFSADDVDVMRLSDMNVHHCMGCNTCENDDCFMEDDMGAIDEALDSADALYIVSPVYFAGPPANYKAVLDRLQPRYWTWKKGQSRRPVTLIAIGDGGDPYGYDPLVTCTSSALSVAGFVLEGTHAFIGASSAEIAQGFEAIVAGLKG